MAAPGPIGVGLVGYGLAGRSFHAPFIAQVEGLRLCAVATNDPDRRARAIEEHPRVDVVAGVDAMLGRADIDVVVVATPNRLHAPIATLALASGRHVVVDKPMAMDVAEGERLVEAAGRAGRLLTVYHNRRWDGDFLTIQRLLAEGALGSLDSLESRFERVAAVDGSWRESAAEVGGPLRDLGPHLIDQALLLFGPARRVWAQLARRRATTQVDDSVFVAIDHAAGGRSRLWMSLIASRVGPRIRLRGLAAEYVKEDLDAQEAQLLSGMRPGDPGFGHEPEARWGRLYRPDGSSQPVATEQGRYLEFYERLRDAMRGRGPVPVEPLDSLQALRVIEAAERAAAMGTVEAMSEG
jgi:scyllo-inositol 2-dehydrogenase (NADP+)